ncbi:MAG: M48 family metallopeptidase [Ruminococcaceae bacterium]|nr:M48 family metallopeptidase [Oscillospiraceae bacterium]
MKIYVADIEVELIRKKIKNMHLYVLRPNGKVRVSAPLRLSEKTIIDFVASRLDWIKKQQAKLAFETRNEPTTYSNGELITIFGKVYVLTVVEGKKNSFTFFNDQAILSCKQNSTEEQRKTIIEKTLRELLYEKLKPLFEKWEGITNLKASTYQIKKMKTRWGTCNTRTKKIWLNFELVKAYEECIEYVILHELAHLKVANHGKDFIAIMDYYMPNWKELREILNKKQ